ncbi:MAG: hypothetical protein MZU79_05900 [Anaerotruncus sp.]|nr:hypothetical protein [Anaerotruncus sp.]
MSATAIPPSCRWRSWAKEPSTQDFFPLMVLYQEKLYSVGKIPGGFLRREGRPSERETLAARSIDRPLRPLFDDNFRNGSPGHQHDSCPSIPTILPEMAALFGSSLALGLGGVPFQGPVAGVVVGRIDGKLDLPTPPRCRTAIWTCSSWGVKVVPGTGGKPYDVNLVMLEGGAKELGEEEIDPGDQSSATGQIHAACHGAAGRDAARPSGRPSGALITSADVIDEALYQNSISGLCDGSGLDQGEALRDLAMKLDRYGKLEATSGDEGRRDPSGQGRCVAQTHRRARRKV